MLKELIEYIKEYEGDNDLGDYLDTRYVRLTDQHYDQIASAMSDGELELKKSSSCPAERFFLHFNETILFVNKQLRIQARRMMLRWLKTREKPKTLRIYYLPLFH